MTQHVDHQDHGADQVEDRCVDCVPEPLMVDLLWMCRRVVRVHCRGDAYQDPRRDVPHDDRDRQCDNVSDTLGEVAEEEEIANESSDQRQRIERHSPSRVRKRPTVKLRAE